MTKCFVFAMEEEAKATIEDFDFVEVIKKPFNFYKNENDYLLITTIGIMNAAAAVMWANENYNIDEYYNLGLVGSIGKKIKVLDIVVIDKVYTANADATGFGYKLGQIPGMPEYHESNKLKFKHDYEIVDLCSSNMFINSVGLFQKNMEIISKNIKVFDMELSGVYSTLYKLNKVKYSIKIVSDVLSLGNNELQFDEILKEGSKKISEVVKKIVSVSH
ncbi:adenosylhomocysteine nucleosidase [Spiroplasma sp. TIUS-1]|uniref:5'-methylthioadenosine/S-adenosylhomocysteine nucleosidase n=1 Tax=Spiroplasma sp. TIUS-1 TaxID=216963 RepID=UPI0013996A16|nr:5'-methylthioadenosine/S-adenosylhomocysteine nucleosidase [Spiroplasma sp. TIUS-1]QHX35948.1 adenosylhomocysteine nucleosidase [Spiroplasma sp. TIUS-1]